MSAEIITEDEAVAKRLKEKAAARMESLDSLHRGKVSPELLQAEHSLFPDGWVENCIIENLYENVGK